MPDCLRMSVKRTAAGAADFFADCCASGAREICGTRRRSARRDARRARFWQEGKLAVIACGRRERGRFAEIAGAPGWEEVAAVWQPKFVARWRGPVQCG